MMARASGRRRLRAEITSRPLPSPSRMSTTAKAGEEVSSSSRPSATDSAVATVKPRPSIAHAHDRATRRRRSVVERERCAGAFQQGLGDEKTQAEPSGIEVHAPPALAGDVGLADPVHDLGRKSRAIVGDGDGDVLRAPVGLDIDLFSGEIDRILQQIAETIEDRRIAPPDW